MNLSKLLFIITLPVIILLIQIFENTLAYTFILILLVVCFFFKKTRKALLLLVVMIAGYLFWKFVSNYVKTFCASNFIINEYSIVLSRLALCGYLIFFTIWFLFDKQYEHYFRIGGFRETIQFPLIWKGFKDTIFRFFFVFSLTCVILACVFAIFNRIINIEKCIKYKERKRPPSLAGASEDPFTSHNRSVYAKRLAAFWAPKNRSRR
jgi:hypothetical protein